ncbi:MAG: glycosyltransferase family 39 protein [Planctomycetota bacterium]
MRPAPDHEPPSGRSPIFWLLLLLGVALRSLDLFDPWSGVGFKSAFGTYTTGLFARNFFEHGFLESGLMPYYWRVELADGQVLREWYTHHPPLYALITGASMRLFGTAEWASRLPWLLLSTWSMFAVHRFAALACGRRVALFAHAVYAVVPLSAWYATMLYTDAAVVGLFAVIASHHLLWLRGGERRHVAIATLCYFLGGMLDWPIVFLLPGLGLIALGQLWQRRSIAPVAPLVVYVGAIAAALVVHRLHMQAVLNAEEASSDTAATLAWVTRLPVPLGEFLGDQLRHARTYVTTPMLVAVAAGGVWLLATRAIPPAARAVTAALALPGPLYIAAFPGRSYNHDFFLFMSLPFIALAAGYLLARLTEAGRVGWQRGLGLASCAVLLGWSVFQMLELRERNSASTVADVVAQPWLAELLEDERAVLLVPSGRCLSLPYYSSAPMVLQVDTPGQLEAWRHRIVDQLEPDRRAVFLLDALAAIAFPELREYLIAHAPAERHNEVENFELGVFDLRAWQGD